MRHAWLVPSYCHIVRNERYKTTVVDFEFGTVNDFKEKCFSFGSKNSCGLHTYTVDNCIIFTSYK